MKLNLTSANVSFNYLSNSKDFLNIILNNITNAVLLLNRNMELQAFNDIMKTIFSNKENEYLLYKRCGEALGCAFHVEEMKDCGETSHCCFCILRESAILSYVEKKAIYKQNVSREFYKTTGEKELKHLLFSTRPFYFEDDYYIIMIIEDISALIQKDQEIKKLQIKPPQ